MNDLNKEIFEINKKANSNNKSKIKENRINSLKKDLIEALKIMIMKIYIIKHIII